MMSEQDYAEMLPFLADWEAPLRAKFVAGMRQLQEIPIRARDAPRIVGVLVVDDEEDVCARYIPRTLAIEKAMADGITADALAELTQGTPPGVIQVLIVQDTLRMLIEVPMAFVPLQYSGARGN